MASSSNGPAARASLTCPNCNLDLAELPAGVRFDPSDQEIIEHLESMVLVKEGGGSSRTHALLNHFIATIEGDNDICYTHPENLPGVTRDGHGKHFFHKTSKAYPTGKRKRRKIMSAEHGQPRSEEAGGAHWHKTGKTRAMMVGGTQKGCKKILVLHNTKPGKRERTNWVMHQYNLGMSEDGKDGELVLSKVFYRFPEETVIEHKDGKVEMRQRGKRGPNKKQTKKVEVTVPEATPNILPVVSSAATVTAATTTDTTVQVQQQQQQLQKQAHRRSRQCKFAPAKMVQEVGVADPVSGDQAQVHDNNHHIPSQHHIQSVDSEPDTTMSVVVQVGVTDQVSGDQAQVHVNNHQVQSQHHVQSLDSRPDTTMSLAVQVGVADPVSGDQAHVHDNNHQVPSQHHVQSVDSRPDTTMSLAVQVGVADPVSGDQAQVHANNHHVPSQHEVQSVDSRPDTTMSLAVQIGVADPVSGDQAAQVLGNNHHVPSQHQVQSVDSGPDTTMSLAVQVGVVDPVSGDQGQMRVNNHPIPSQDHVGSVDSGPDTTLSLGLSTGW